VIRKLLSSLDVVILAVSVYLLFWGFLPPRREDVSQPLLLPDGLPSLPGQRVIRIAYSPVMRAGETQTIELNLTSEGDEQATRLYNDYNLIAEARLDMSLADVRPLDLISTALVEGGKATFYWEVYPRQAGTLRGTIWLYLRFFPKTGGEEFRQPVSAQLIEIRSRSLLGWTGSVVRSAGVVMFLLGLTLGGLILFSSRVN